MLHVAVTRVCKVAGIPRTCPHYLRGLWATLSVESGAAESAVAATLGHGSFEMTAKHYAQAEAVSGARSARVLDLLDEAPPEPDFSQLSAEQLASNPTRATLAKLLAMIMASSFVGKKETPTKNNPSPFRTNSFDRPWVHSLKVPAFRRDCSPAPLSRLRERSEEDGC